MARRGGRLSPMQVSKAKPPPGRRAVVLCDGLGLHLQVTTGKDGTLRKSWTFRYELHGRRHEIGLGALHTRSLSEARIKARELRLQLLEGTDPLAAKREKRAEAIAEAQRTLTFKEAAEGYIAAHRASWRSIIHANQWAATLKTYAFPVIGSLPVAAIDLPLILKIIEPHWRDKYVTMSRLRGRIAAVLDWAAVRGYRQGDNPAAWKGRLEHLLPSPSASPRHHAAIAWRDVPQLMTDLRSIEGQAARALEFVILTATRSSEVTGARWSEIDLAAKTWTIPGNRMKRGREHKVPLSERAVAILETLPRGDEVVFSRFGKDQMRRALQSLRPGATTHGMRSAFRDWTAERTNYPREIAEACLAHAIPNAVEATYLRGSFWEKRVRLMDEWGRFCTSPPSSGEVVPLHRSAADA